MVFAASHAFMSSANLRNKLANLKAAIKEGNAALELFEQFLLEGEPAMTRPPWHVQTDKQWVGEDMAWGDAEEDGTAGEDSKRLKYGPDTTPCRGYNRWVSRVSQYARTGPYIPATKYQSAELWTSYGPSDYDGDEDDEVADERCASSSWQCL